MPKSDKKKSLFSKKGDSEDFDYLKHQVWFTIAAALFFSIMFFAIRQGWIAF